MKRTFFTAATLVTAMFFAVSASAVTIANGDHVGINSGDEFLGLVLSDGSAGSWMVEFDATVDLLAGAEAAVLTSAASAFTDLTMTWKVVSGPMLATTSVLAGLTSLATVFTTTPDYLSQYLMLSWTGSELGTFFTVSVSASDYIAHAPLPAGLLLIITAFSGLAIVGRRRRKATVG